MEDYALTEFRKIISELQQSNLLLQKKKQDDIGFIYHIFDCIVQVKYTW